MWKMLLQLEEMKCVLFNSAKVSFHDFTVAYLLRIKSFSTEIMNLSSGFLNKWKIK